MANMTDFPKLLVLGNCCMSQTNSNGRTLRNFLLGWPQDKLAQFCLQNNDPDFSLCRNYFCITDHDALRALLHHTAKDGQLDPDAAVNAPLPTSSASRKRARNSISMLLRDLVWSSNQWRKPYFDAWVSSFCPEIILLQAGDFPYMFKLATELSKKYHIPLVIYNSEVYYFKDFDYFRSNGMAKLLYPVFRTVFRRQCRKTMKHAAASVYPCDMITELYSKEFSSPAYTLYTATEVTPADKPSASSFRVSYLGNLGVGRHHGLVEIANALQHISPNLHLDVYGKIPTQAVKDAFDACPGIRYCGFVSYEDVLRIMGESDLLVHTESFDDYYKIDLKYAFSTKIADCLASGTSFLLYAPEEIACADYLTRNAAAHVVSSKASLEATLETLYREPAARNMYIHTAQQLVAANHNAEKNAAAFQHILKSAAFGRE